MSAIILVTRYRDTTVNHQHFTFQYSASQFNRIRLIQEDQRVNYKYCPTCNICYKKSYYKSHQKNKFHKAKQNVINDAKDKRLNEFSLERTIDVHLNALLKNNDLNIGNIICDYLKDTCNDCKEETTNPDTYIVNKERVNVCQHCRNKYKSCCETSCTFIGTKEIFKSCIDCKQLGCFRHMKKIIGRNKYRCVHCSHNAVDKLYVKEVTKNQEVINLNEKVIDLKVQVKNIIKKGRENKQLKVDLILAKSKNIRNNTIINAREREINDLRQELAYMKRKEEKRKQMKIDRIVGRIF